MQTIKCETRKKKQQLIEKIKLPFEGVIQILLIIEEAKFQ
jgi:hypothetical protein